jgi:hypothetical protein
VLETTHSKARLVNYCAALISHPVQVLIILHKFVSLDLFIFDFIYSPKRNEQVDFMSKIDLTDDGLAEFNKF